MGGTWKFLVECGVVWRNGKGLEMWDKCGGYGEMGGVWRFWEKCGRVWRNGKWDGLQISGGVRRLREEWKGSGGFEGSADEVWKYGRVCGRSGERERKRERERERERAEVEGGMGRIRKFLVECGRVWVLRVMRVLRALRC